MPLHTLKEVALAICLLGLAQSVGAETGSCALKLRVVSPTGAAASGQPVEVRDSLGAVVFEGTVQNGNLDICDLDFGDHSVRVGRSNGCLPVVVERVRLDPIEPQTITVVQNPCPGPLHFSYSNYCRTYLRVKKPDGSPASGCQAQVDPWPAVPCDEFGRVVVKIMSGTDKLVKVFDASGVPVEFALRCNQFENIERTVRLAPVPQRPPGNK